MWRHSIKLLIFLVSHYGYLYVHPVSEKEVSPFWNCFWFTFGLWQLILWGTVYFFWRLDTYGSSRYRKIVVGSNKQEPPFSLQCLISCRNIMIITPIALFMGLQIEQVGWLTRSRDGSLMSTALRFLLVVLVSDVFFYCGHVLMHKWKWLYSFTHKRHHSSWALTSIGGYYMDVLDFLLEHGSVFVSWFLCGNCGPEVPAVICVGVFNVLVTHSGWDLWCCPDPRNHFIHHYHRDNEYGIVLDHVFNTKASSEQQNAITLKFK